MSAITDFISEFGRAFSHLVVWAFLLGIVAHLLQPAAKSRAWRNMLAVSFPHAKVRWRDAYGSYLVKSGAGTFLPMHGDDAVRVAVMKDRVKGVPTAGIAATAGAETVFDVLLTAALIAVSAWLGASILDWHAIAAHPAKPIIVLVMILVAIGTAVVALRKRAQGLGDELKQGLLIFKRPRAYFRTVFHWQALAFALELAGLYFLLVAFGLGATVTGVVLIRTAQRVTVSLPGFLETGSQQAMIIAILTAGGHTAGQAFGFGFGSKVTFASLDVVMALVAARIMMGPLHLRARVSEKLHRGHPAPASERDFPQLAGNGADVTGAGQTPSSVS
jgi:cbb3-type cytochrome oxidase subunit 3